MTFSKQFNLEYDKIKTMLDDGCSQRIISEYYGCTQALIHIFCKKHNLKSKHIQKIALNLKNTKCGYLEILECVGQNPGKYGTNNIWKCKCKCGTIVELPPYAIRKNQSCGCIQQEQKWIQERGNWRGYEEISLTYYNRIYNGAKSRNLECNISIEEIWNLYVQQDRKCNLTGLNIYFKFGKNQTQTASLDRKNSNIGYIIDNIQWIHKDINKMKMDFDEKYFIDICKLIANKN